ncbi:MAG: hypothetical protein ACK4GL_11895, partial [Flavobacteriales bacterium]
VNLLFFIRQLKLIIFLNCPVFGEAYIPSNVEACAYIRIGDENCNNELNQSLLASELIYLIGEMDITDVNQDVELNVVGNCLLHDFEMCEEFVYNPCEGMSANLNIKAKHVKLIGDECNYVVQGNNNLIQASVQIHIKPSNFHVASGKSLTLKIDQCDE